MYTDKTLMERIENFLRSTSGMFISLVMVLAFSTPNTTEVLTKIHRLPYIDDSQVRWIALSFAIVIEFVILILATIGQQRGAKIYAVASFVFHLLYYHRWDELLTADYSNPLLLSAVYTNFIASIVTSFMISGSIWYFSEMLGKMIDAKTTYFNLNKESDMIREHIERDEQVLNSLEKDVSTHQQKITEMKQSKAELYQDISRQEQHVSKLHQEKLGLENQKAALEEKVISLKKQKAGLTQKTKNEAAV